ncbi:MAG: DUF2339 domain-containing protein [Sphingomonadaceae bacterium]|nr:DUF2339 domain-containing protein [Sphingomonadaceae bacterium]
MIVWTAVLSAILGWVLVDFEDYGFLLGGLFGGVAGWALRRGVRAEILRETELLRAQIDGLLARGITTSPPAVAPGAQNIDRSATAPPTASAGLAARGVTEPVSTTRIDAPVPRDPEPAAQAEPVWIETMVATAFDAAKTWLFGGNTIVRVGLIILFVGLSFLASYAASAGLFPIELRLALVAAIGIALLAVGFRTRAARPDFGLALQGGGIAIVYLTLFAAAKLYEFFPITAAFILMIAVCALGCALALLQRSQALAATAFAGGFAVPLLLSSGGGNIVVVFIYYTILNLAILFIAHRQSWRVLNLIGFFATFGVATIWGVTAYRTTDFVPAQITLIASVLIYVATAVLYARATPGRLGNIADTTLLFGPALAGFGLQVGLVHDRPFGSAFAALGFAALYLGVAAWTMRYRRESFRVMNETMLAIGIGFVTLAIPLALGARWTLAAWALEGAGAFWVGMRQARWMPRLFGILLQLMAALVYLASLHGQAFPLPLANAGFVGAMLIALAALATAWWLRAALPHSGSTLARFYARFEGQLAKPVFLLGFVFWCAAWTVEAMRSVPSPYAGQLPVPVFTTGMQILLAMLAYLISAGGAQQIGRRWNWPVACWPSYASLLVLALSFISVKGSGGYLLYSPDWAIWIAAIGLHLWMTYRNEDDPTAADRHRLLDAIHIGGIWLATAMLADCLWLGIDRALLWGTGWAEVTFLIAATAMLAALAWWGGRAMRAQPIPLRWPLDTHAIAYGWYAAIPIAGLTFFGALLTAVFSSGATDPLPYLPLINPVDLTLGLALAGLEMWRRAMLASDPRPLRAALLSGRGALGALAALAFIMINTVWLRIAHHMLGVSWEPDAMLANVVVQTGLAILWTSLALVLMAFAYRRGRRTLWLVGAGLLGLTVVKLLLVDLGNAGGGARIVAFIVVGLLMLVVGYLAPLPPKTAIVPQEGGVPA